jgi:DNA-binding MarR family transcriptional regulator
MSKVNQTIPAIREGLRRFNRRAGVLKADPYGLDLSLSQSSALVDIERFKSITPKHLASLLHLEKSSVSRLLAVLAKKKLVQIKMHSTDRRSKTLTLTPLGKKAVRTIHHASNRSVAELLQAMPLKEQSQISTAFRLILKTMNEIDPVI